MAKKTRITARKEMKKSLLKKIKGKKFEEKKGPEKKKQPKEIIEEKTENLEEQLERTEEEINGSGFVEFLKPTGKTAPVLERVAIQRNVELENKIADIPARRENREERIVNYSENKSDYSPTTNAERTGARNINYAEKTAATYSPTQKKDETRRSMVNPIRGEWENRRKRADRPDAEVGSFERIERENPDKKYLEKGMSEYYR